MTDLPTKIVVLDGYTLAASSSSSSEDEAGSVAVGASDARMDWQPLSALGDLTVYDRTPADLVVTRARGAELVLVNKVLMPREVLDQLPGLRYIGVTATGVNNVDLVAARARGISVTHVPAYGPASVAQHTIALLLELSNRLGDHDRAAHDGTWQRRTDFSCAVAPMVELAGKTMGVIGVGAIGRRVAAIAAALGMVITAAHQSSMASVRIPGVEIQWLTTDALLRRADVVTLHCPLNDQTRYLINAQRLAMMKRSAFLINTSRGPLVDERALADALHAGRLAGAGLDVLCVEPPPQGHCLLTAPRCVITPHVAWATAEAKARLLDQVVANARAFLQGQPIHVVN